jgi:glutamate--cysteine ligase
LSDWANHLSTIFPEVRLKRYLEMRGADGVPWGRLPALPAFWVGLLYDDESLNAAWDLVSHWTAAGASGLARRRAALRLQGQDQGSLSCSRSPRNA